MIPVGYFKLLIAKRRVYSTQPAITHVVGGISKIKIANDIVLPKNTFFRSPRSSERDFFEIARVRLEEEKKKKYVPRRFSKTTVPRHFKLRATRKLS